MGDEKLESIEEKSSIALLREITERQDRMEKWILAASKTIGVPYNT